jgi:homoserine O-acetyltransferase
MKEQSFYYPFNFKLESGEQLPELRLQYYTAGELNANHDNVIWICHPLWLNGNVSQWWASLVGPGKVFDTDHYFIISVDALAGMGKSTGPLSIDPVTKTNFFHRFPQISIADISNSFEILRDHLKIDNVHSMVGVEMGAQIAVNWLTVCPRIASNLILFGGGSSLSQWSSAQFRLLKEVIELDATWQLNSRKAGENSMPIILKMLKIAMAGAISQSNAVNELFCQLGEKVSINPYSLLLLTEASKKFEIKEKLLNKIKANCFIILAADDPLPNHNAHLKLTQHLDNAVLHFIPSARGSFTYFDKPAHIENVLKDYKLPKRYKQKLA